MMPRALVDVWHVFVLFLVLLRVRGNRPAHAKQNLSQHVHAHQHLAKRTSDCCACHTIPVEQINQATQQYRDALERTLAEWNEERHEETSRAFWFPIEGTLIGALRFGQQVERLLDSGSLNFVDDDIDIVLACPRKDRDQLWNKFVKTLAEHHSGWVEAGGFKGIRQLASNVMVPHSCDDMTSSQDGKAFYSDVHFMDIEDKEGSPAFRPDPGTSQVWSSQLSSDGLVSRDLILPLQRGRWGLGEGYFIPNKAVEMLLHWGNSGNEYGIPWEPRSGLATGGSFRCQCDVTAADMRELERRAQQLDDQQLASFHRYFPTSP